MKHIPSDPIQIFEHQSIPSIPAQRTSVKLMESSCLLTYLDITSSLCLVHEVEHTHICIQGKVDPRPDTLAISSEDYADVFM
jgi:hypothetical protein